MLFAMVNNIYDGLPGDDGPDRLQPVLRAGGHTGGGEQPRGLQRRGRAQRRIRAHLLTGLK